MASNIIRGQAAAVVLALLDQQIFYANYRYPNDVSNTYTAKITREQFEKIETIKQNIRDSIANPTQQGYSIDGVATIDDMKNTRIFAVMETNKGTSPFTVVEVISTSAYADITTEIDPLNLKYLAQIITNDAYATLQEKEAEAVDRTTKQLINNTKKNQALALLGEDGVRDLTEYLNLGSEPDKIIVNSDAENN